MRSLKQKIERLEGRLAAAPPSACAPLVRRLVKYKRRFLHLPPPKERGNGKKLQEGQSAVRTGRSFPS